MKKPVSSIINEYMDRHLSEQDSHALEAWNKVKAAVLGSVSGIAVNRSDDGVTTKNGQPEPPVKPARRSSTF